MDPKEGMWGHVQPHNRFCDIGIISSLQTEHSDSLRVHSMVVKHAQGIFKACGTDSSLLELS